MYSFGRTVLPVCPTWRSLSIHPASTHALEEEISPPNSSASSFNISKPSGPPIPRPPDTRILASVISTVFFVSLTTSRILMFISASLTPASNTSTVPDFDGSASSACITPGLTVAIWGRKFGQTIVAMILPPKAGRVIQRPFVSSSISSFVQSAVKPVCTLADTRGARSRPIAVAP